MKESTLLCISRCSLFKDIELDALRRLLHTVPYSVHDYEKHTLILVQGEECAGLHILLAGEVDTLMDDHEGRKLRVETLRAPEAIASSFLFARENVLPVSVRTRKRVRILVLPKQSVLQFGRQHPELFVAMIEDSADKIMRLAAKLKFSQFNTIRQKIASYLIEQAARQRALRVSLGCSKEALAEMFGVTRPALSRIFSELFRSGAIRQEGKLVCIRNIEELRDILAHRSGDTKGEELGSC
jgi:CRP-like cAMP-binding protein